MPHFITYNMYNPSNAGLFSLPWHEEDKTMTQAILTQTSALAAVLYIAQKLECPDFHKVCKLLYLADKLHLQQYGRVITDENYEAYPFGPVPKDVYGMMDKERFEHKERFGFAFVPQGKVPCIVARVAPDFELLSKSDIECLDAVIDQYGTNDFGSLTEISHDSAWTAGRKRTGKEILLGDIVQTLPNAQELTQYLSGSHL
jgi:uncharacterized phage-associated protein